jgi:hypothetical protein
VGGHREALGLNEDYPTDGNTMTPSKTNLGVAAVVGALRFGVLACGGSTPTVTGPGYLNPVTLAAAIKSQYNSDQARKATATGPEIPCPPPSTVPPTPEAPYTLPPNENPDIRCTATLPPADQSNADWVVCNPSGNPGRFTCTAAITTYPANGGAVTHTHTTVHSTVSPDGASFQDSK